MRCSEAAAASRAGSCARPWRVLVVGVALLVGTAPPAPTRRATPTCRSTAAPGQLDVRWDIALRDLDVALDLDSDADGKLTWGEVRGRLAAHRGLCAAAAGHRGLPARAGRPRLERRNDGAYAGAAAARRRARCRRRRASSYSLFAEVDPTHRGIAKVQRAGPGGRLVGARADVPCVAAGRDGAAAASASADRRGRRSADAAPRALSGAAALGFLREGVRHILTGYDHVLFLLCLLLPSVMRRTPRGLAAGRAALARRCWPVVGIVSAFTVAHSITLGLAALKLVSLSPAFIEPAIAVTIILAALDNVLPIFPVRRVVVTFFFGLIHGFGFAGVLAELNLPRADFAWALLQFNLGLEVGQLLIVAVATTALFTLRAGPATLGSSSAAARSVAIVDRRALVHRADGNVSILPF